MPTLATGSYRQDRRIYTESGKNKYEIEAIVTNAGTFPDEFWFLYNIVDSSNSILDTFERVALSEDFSTYLSSRQDAIDADQTLYRKSSVKATYDDVSVAVAGIAVLHDLINEQALVYSISTGKFFPDVIAEQYNVPQEETTFATLVTGLDTGGNDNQLLWTARVPGPEGNNIKIYFIDPASAGYPLTIEVVQAIEVSPYNADAFELLTKINIYIGTDGGSALISTRQEVLGAIAQSVASNYVSVSSVTGTVGTNMTVVATDNRLSGGNRGVSATEALIASYAAAKAAEDAQIAVITAATSELEAEADQFARTSVAVEDMITMQASTLETTDALRSNLYLQLQAYVTSTVAFLTSLTQSVYTIDSRLAESTTALDAADYVLAASRMQTAFELNAALKPLLNQYLDTSVPLQVDVNSGHPSNTNGAVTTDQSILALVEKHKQLLSQDRVAAAAAEQTIASATDRLVQLQTLTAAKLAEIRAYDPSYAP